MAVFGIVTEESKIVENAINNIKEKLDSSNPVKNPFRGKLTGFKFGYVMAIYPLYPNVTFFGWLGAIALYYLFGWSNWIIAFIIIGVLGVFWSKYFYMFALWLSLRKAGYKGKIKFLNSDEIISGWFI